MFLRFFYAQVSLGYHRSETVRSDWIQETSVRCYSLTLKEDYELENTAMLDFCYRIRNTLKAGLKITYFLRF